MTEVPEDRVRDLERGADEMEEGLGRLEADLETAHERADEQRERADPDAVAGDWEDESAGAQQGDDAQDAAGRGRDEATADDRSGDGGTAIADAPVHDAALVADRQERAPHLDRRGRRGRQGLGSGHGRRRYAVCVSVDGPGGTRSGQ